MSESGEGPILREWSFEVAGEKHVARLDFAAIERLERVAPVGTFAAHLLGRVSVTELARVVFEGIVSGAGGPRGYQGPALEAVGAAIASRGANAYLEGARFLVAGIFAGGKPEGEAGAPDGEAPPATADSTSGAFSA